MQPALYQGAHTTLVTLIDSSPAPASNSQQRHEKAVVQGGPRDRQLTQQQAPSLAPPPAQEPT
jgi:hypothetical protein